MTRPFASIALAAVLAAAAAAPAFAAETLDLSNLDFTRAGDIEAFQARLGTVQETCRRNGLDSPHVTGERACRRAVEAEVVSKMSPRLRTAYEAALKARKAAERDGIRTAGSPSNRG